LNLYLIEGSPNQKVTYQGKTVQEVYEERLPLYKQSSMHRFSIPPYKLMSCLYSDEESYKKRLTDVFTKFIENKWISPSSIAHSLPVSDSFFA
jgi:hypothetical protein